MATISLKELETRMNNLTISDGSVTIQKLDSNLTTKINQIDTKVDKVIDKQLSTEDYTSTEKTKLAGIATGANNYTHPASHAASIITQDSTHRFVTDTEKSTWNAKAGTAVATTSVNGLMSSTDKTKLDDVDNLKYYSTYKSNKDANGIYTTVEIKRTNGTLYMKSILSGGTSPNYTTRTETWYATNGTTVLTTKVYTRTYDSDNVLVSEVTS